jgi:site-specific DNA-methyltransferase (adenine-specific)
MWAFQAWAEDWSREALRVLKPGGHLLAFGGTRTFHRLACAIEDAGGEIRDCLSWLYGTGFPKSHNLPGGIGTALKPAWEPIILARKPLVGTVAANIRAHGTGGLNIDASRVSTSDNLNGGAYSGGARPTSAMGCTGDVGGTSSLLEAGGGRLDPSAFVQPSGRWPANLIHDGSDEVTALFPTTGPTRATAGVVHRGRSGGIMGAEGAIRDGRPEGHNDPGGNAARFFYCAKASKSDRSDGNTHPTVKPTGLMRYLCRLVTPPGAVVLDPFTGSGTTGVACQREGFRFVGVEREAKYVEIARARIAASVPAATLFGASR